MTIHDHYPIYPDAFYLNQKQLLTYLNTFQHHGTELIKNYALIITKHYYSDELYIQTRWEIIDEQRFIFSSIKRIDDLASLEREGLVKCVTAEIVRYSKENYEPTIENIEKYRKIVKLAKITPTEYQFLEHEIYEETTLSPEFFNELMKSVENWAAFEDYLKQNNL